MSRFFLLFMGLQLWSFSVYSSEDSIRISKYIRYMYISLCNRPPTQNELTKAYLRLTGANHTAGREEWIIELLNNPYFAKNVYQSALTNYLQNTDSIGLSELQKVYMRLLHNPEYSHYKDLLQFEIDRIETLQRSQHELILGTIDISQLHKRTVNNDLYDQYNMGTENFVVSCFQYFLLRYPEVKEKEEAEKMVDGYNAQLFRKNGSSKEDFLEIIFNSSEYKEATVRSFYKQFFFTEPDATWLSSLTKTYATTGNYKLMLCQMLCNPAIFDRCAPEKTLKTPTQFIHLAYRQLHGQPIPQTVFNRLNMSANTLGDKATVRLLIVKSLLDDPSLKLSTVLVLETLHEVISTVFYTLLERQPNAHEIDTIKKFFVRTRDMQLKDIYYAIMISDEYAYY